MIINPNTNYLPSTNIHLIPTPLRRADPASPYCYTASLSPTLDNPSPTLPSSTNFLATQVWPSARTASFVIEKCCRPEWTVCELGCGPGLPSITAASLGCNVIATDVDTMALQMVELAAVEQGFVKEGRFSTRIFDLTRIGDDGKEELPMADLYVMSDVFESGAVAKGAAWHVWRLLEDDNAGYDDTDDSSSSIRINNSRVWVFAQSDRAQRDIFLKSLKEYDSKLFANLDWNAHHEPDLDARLWLFDLNEMDVQYN